MKKGDLYYFQFWDHSIGDSGIMKCEVVGWIIDIDKTSVTITFWQPVTDCKKTYDENLEKTALVISTIIKKKKLKI